jgi:hypothetical protein
MSAIGQKLARSVRHSVRHADGNSALGFACSGRIDRGNQGDVRSVLRADYTDASFAHVLVRENRSFIDMEMNQRSWRPGGGQIPLTLRPP